MLERGKLDRGVVELVDTESLVPWEYLLRKIDTAVDFNRIYELLEPLYSEDNGRPSVDPAVLFKLVLFQHLYGLPSLPPLLYFAAFTLKSRILYARIRLFRHAEAVRKLRTSCFFQFLQVLRVASSRGLPVP